MKVSKLGRAHLFVIGAWLLHAISWFLPVVRLGGAHGLLSDPVRGWTAFIIALGAVWPSAGVHADEWYYAVLSTLSALATVLFVFGSPWVIVRGSRSVRRICAWAAAIAFVIDAHWYVLFGADRKDLAIGYFLWWLSFGLLAVGLFDLSTGNQSANVNE